MSSIHVTNVIVHNTKVLFNTPFKFDISFECYSPIVDGNLVDPCHTKQKPF